MKDHELLIFKYLDGECSPGEKKQVEDLLASDEGFAAMFHEFKQANDLLMNNELMDVPKGFSERVMQQIDPGRQFRLNGLFFPKFLLAGMVFVALLFSTDYLFDIDLSVMEQFVSANNVVYGVSLLFFFLIIEVILQKQDKELLH